jgi:hypothetical protein
MSNNDDVTATTMTEYLRRLCWLLDNPDEAGDGEDSSLGAQLMMITRSYGNVAGFDDLASVPTVLAGAIANDDTALVSIIGDLLREVASDVDAKNDL